MTDAKKMCFPPGFGVIGEFSNVYEVCIFAARGAAQEKEPEQTRKLYSPPTLENISKSDNSPQNAPVTHAHNP